MSPGAAPDGAGRCYKLCNAICGIARYYKLYNTIYGAALDIRSSHTFGRGLKLVA